MLYHISATRCTYAVHVLAHVVGPIETIHVAGGMRRGPRRVMRDKAASATRMRLRAGPAGMGSSDAPRLLLLSYSVGSIAAIANQQMVAWLASVSTTRTFAD